MKVGTDGVLLGCCVKIQGDEQRLLDIGTGTGLVALIATQRLWTSGNSTFVIDAVEIDGEAAAQAAENCRQSPWSDHIEVHHAALADFDASDSASRYDLILSNPPFYNATLKPDDEARAMARHKDAMPLQQIMKCAQRRLTVGGRLVLIYPTAYDSEVMREAAVEGLIPCRIIDIVTKAGKPCKRRIVEMTRTGEGSTLDAETLTLRDDSNDYSAEYRTLTEPFYLHLK